MGTIVAATVGLVVWIVLWALKVSGFDAIMIVIVLVLVALMLRNVLPNLARRRDG